MNWEAEGPGAPRRAGSVEWITAAGVAVCCALAGFRLALCFGALGDTAVARIAPVGIDLFFALFTIVLVGSTLFQRFERGRPFFCAAVAVARWQVRWMGWVGTAVAVGACLGMLLFAAAWLLLPLDRNLPSMIAQGARDGAFYVFIWAPGGAFVLCVMEARRASRRAGDRAQSGTHR